MLNPNTNEQIMKYVASDLEFLGFVVTDITTKPDWCLFRVGNQSIEFAFITIYEQRITIRANGKTYKTIPYKGSLEKYSEDVCAKLVKIALKKAWTMK